MNALNTIVGVSRVKPLTEQTNPVAANLAAIAEMQTDLGAPLMNEEARKRKRGPGRPRKGGHAGEAYHHDSRSYGIDRLQGVHVPVHLSRSEKKQKTEGKEDDERRKETRRRCIICKQRVQFFCAQCNTAICFGANMENGGKDSCWYTHHHTI
jgi:hypothetical protein